MLSAIPEPALTVSQWAATNRFVSPERSARPGQWSNEIVPHAVEIMDAASDPAVREIVFQAPSQIAKTEVACNVMGYFIDTDPSQIMYCAESEDKARAFSNEAFTPMVRDTPALDAKCAKPRERDAGNTMTSIKFPGGHLAIVWASSPAALSSRARRVMIFDELDAYEGTKEGNPVTVATARQTTYEGFELTLKISSPRLKQTSLICPAWEASDQRDWYVPCPHCGEYQMLVWRDGDIKRVRWDNDRVDQAYYVCVNGCVIEHEQKAGMLARGEWRAAKDFNGIAGFRIFGPSSPFMSWASMAKRFIKAKGIIQDLQAWINTCLGEAWDPESIRIETGDLAKRGETYTTVPDNVLVLTAAVDVQHDRLECEVVGWGLDDESWSMTHEVFLGDPGKADVWSDLRNFLTQDFETETGEVMRIWVVCIDSGGHHAEAVHRFAYANKGRRWYPVKGSSLAGRAIVSKFNWWGKPRVKLWPVGTDTAKDQLQTQLGTAEPGPNYCHFPAHYDEAYFQQLCSEHRTVKLVNGRPKSYWAKLKPGEPNEALDLRVYNLAALGILKAAAKGPLRRKYGVRAATETKPPIDPLDGSDDGPGTSHGHNSIAAKLRRTGRRGGFAKRW